MTSLTLKNEGCGYDGQSEHQYRYGGNDTRVSRTCIFCGRHQESKVKWIP